MASWRAFAQVAALTVVVGGSPPVAGAKKSERVVAVFPLVIEGRVAPEIVEVIEKALTERAPEGKGLRVLYGPELHKKLKRNPRRAVNRCQRRRVAVTCFARLASKLKADELLVGRAKATAEGVAVLLLAVGRNRSVAPRGQFEVKSADDADEIFTDERLRQFYGVSNGVSTPVAAPEPVSEPVAKAEPESPAVASAKESVASAATKPDKGSSQSEEIVGVQASDAPVVAALSPNVLGPLPITESAVSRDTGLTWLTYAGIGLAVLAAGGLGYGGYLGYQSSDVRSAIKRDGTLVQKEAVAKADRANDLARQANLWMGIGAGVMALSITFVGIDLLVD